MKRVRAPISEVERDVRRLRMDPKPLSASDAEHARWEARMMMEIDCRNALLKEAPPEARAALMTEFNATFFMAGTTWPRPFFTTPTGGCP